MSLELNLIKIAHLAEQNQAENHSFGKYLKQQNLQQIDQIVHRLNKTISNSISCVDCGNCCRNLRPIATDEALLPFVLPENIATYKYLKEFTCKNLACNRCSVYDERPEECRQYPYLHRDNFVNRTGEIIQNYEICPIVFNVVEQLKVELKWQNK